MEKNSSVIPRMKNGTEMHPILHIFIYFLEAGPRAEEITSRSQIISAPSSERKTVDGTRTEMEFTLPPT